MKRKLIVVISLILVIIIGVTACQKAGTGKIDLSKVPDIPTEPVEVAQKDMKAGWFGFSDFGFKYKLPAFRMEEKVYQHIDFFDIGDPKDEKNPIYKGLTIKFLQEDILLKLFEIQDDQNITFEEYEKKVKALLEGKEIEMGAHLVLRRSAVDNAESVEALTGYPNNALLGKNKEFVYAYCWDNGERGKNLPAKDKEVYDKIIADMPNDLKTMQIGALTPSEQDFEGIKGFTFTSQDTEGNAVDQSVFKKAKLTMINVWTTWCGPCKAEMPDLAKLATNEFKDMGVQIYGIVADVDNENPDPDDLALAKSLMENAGTTYVNLLADKSMKEQLLLYVSGFPTTLFVDQNGDIVGELIVGSRSQEEFIKEAQDRLNLLDK